MTSQESNKPLRTLKPKPRRKATSKRAQSGGGGYSRYSVLARLGLMLWTLAVTGGLIVGAFYTDRVMQRYDNALRRASMCGLILDTTAGKMPDQVLQIPAKNGGRP